MLVTKQSIISRNQDIADVNGSETEENMFLIQAHSL